MATVQDLLGLDLDELELLHDSIDQSDPKMPMLKEALRQKRNPALTPERQAKVNRQYEATKLPEPGFMEQVDQKVGQGLDKAGRFLGIIPDDRNGTAEDAGTLGGVARNIYKQGNATAAGAINSVPFLGRGMEALGDLEGRHIGTHFMPRPGELSAIEESAPSPATAKVSGAVATMTGGLGRLMATPYEAGKAIIGKIPGLGRVPGAATVGGATAGGALQATGDAAIRRVPNYVEQEPVEPIDWVHEVGEPAALSGAFAVPGAAKEAAVHVPRERSSKKPSGGEIAQKYATDRRLGREFTPEGEKQLQDAIEESKTAGQRRTEEAVGKEKRRIENLERVQRKEMDSLAGRGEFRRAENKAARERELAQAKADQEEALLSTKRAQEDDLSRLDKESEADIANTAAEQHKRFLEKFGAERKAEKDELQRGLDALMASPKVHDAAGNPMRFGNAPLKAEIDGFVKKEYARELGPSEQGQPESTLGLGAEMRGVYNDLFKGTAKKPAYLGEESSIRDYRNAITQLQANAERGTPVQQRAYANVLDALRTHLETVDPTKTIGPINDRYRTAASKRERLTGMVHGTGDENVDVSSSPEKRFDNPDDQPVTPAVSPQLELRGAARFRKVGEPEYAAHDRELRELGYGDFVTAMEEAKARRSAMKTEAQRKGEDSLRSQRLKASEELAGKEAEFTRADDAIRGKVLESKGKLSDLHDADMQEAKQRMSREKEAQEGLTELEVRDRTAELDDFQAGSKAREASRWPGYMDIAKDLVPGVLGSHLPGRFGAASKALSAIAIGRDLAQPLRSRAAYYLPEAGAYEAGLSPSLSAMVSALDERQKSKTGVPKLTLDKLRALRDKLGITQ